MFKIVIDLYKNYFFSGLKVLRDFSGLKFYLANNMCN